MSNLDLFIAVTEAIILILIISQICAKLMSKLGQPAVVGEMIAGILLGPTCLGYFFPSFSAQLFAPVIMPYLFVLGNLGLSVYMFLMGAELNFEVVDSSVIKQSIWISLATVLIPLICGAALSHVFFSKLSGGQVSESFFSIFTGTALAITAFPMMARILSDYDLIRTRLGGLVMLSASIQDVISWILLGFVTSMAKKQGTKEGFIILAGAIVFTTIIWFVVRPVFKKIGDTTEKNKSLSSNHFSILIVTLLICALITDKIGLYSVFGGFILGLAMPKKGKVFQQEINSRLKYLSITLLLPMFFTFSGLNSNLLVLSKMTYITITVIIIIVAFGSKYLSCLLAMRMNGFSWRESSAVGGLVNARGLMELIVTNIGLAYGIINKEFFSILVLVAILTTLMAMPIFKMTSKKVTKPSKAL